MSNGIFLRLLLDYHHLDVFEVFISERIKSVHDGGRSTSPPHSPFRVTDSFLSLTEYNSSLRGPDTIHETYEN